MTEQYHDSEQKTGRTTSGGYWWEDSPEEFHRQRLARDAIIKRFTVVDRAGKSTFQKWALVYTIRHVTRYGPHDEMLAQLVHWFAKRGMYDRWTLYKTQAEWTREVGFGERQIRAGRKPLCSRNLIGWKRGQYGRIHYRVNWCALDRLLDPKTNNDAKAVVIEDEDRLDEAFNNDTKAVVTNNDTVAVATNNDGKLSDPTQQDTHQGYSPGSTLQVGGKPPKKKQEKAQPPTQLDNDTPPPEKPSSALLSEVEALLDPTTGRWWGAQHVNGSHTPERIAEYVTNDPDVETAYEAEQIAAAIAYMRWENAHQ